MTKKTLGILAGIGIGVGILGAKMALDEREESNYMKELNDALKSQMKRDEDRVLFNMEVEERIALQNRKTMDEKLSPQNTTIGNNKKTYL
jgi:hypothetical protein